MFKKTTELCKLLGYRCKNGFYIESNLLIDGKPEDMLRYANGGRTMLINVLRVRLKRAQGSPRDIEDQIISLTGEENLVKMAEFFNLPEYALTIIGRVQATKPVDELTDGQKAQLMLRVIGAITADLDNKKAFNVINGLMARYDHILHLGRIEYVKNEVLKKITDLIDVTLVKYDALSNMYLIDSVNKLGFEVTPNEVTLYFHSGKKKFSLREHKTIHYMLVAFHTYLKPLIENPVHFQLTRRGRRITQVVISYERNTAWHVHDKFKPLNPYDDSTEDCHLITFRQQ